MVYRETWITQSTPLLFSALEVLHREKSKPTLLRSERGTPPSSPGTDDAMTFLREPEPCKMDRQRGSLWLYPVRKSITDIFLESGKKKQRLSQIQKLFTKQLPKKFTGVGWGIRIMFSFQISHMVLMVYKREWPISVFLTSPPNTSESSWYFPYPHPNPPHPVPKLICHEPTPKTHDCWLGFNSTMNLMLEKRTKGHRSALA